MKHIDLKGERREGESFGGWGDKHENGNRYDLLVGVIVGGGEKLIGQHRAELVDKKCFRAIYVDQEREHVR